MAFGVLARWFPKNKRSSVLGFFLTFGVLGKLIGVRIYLATYETGPLYWGNSLLIVSILTFLSAATLFMLLKPRPEDLSFEIAENFSIKDSRMDNRSSVNEAQNIFRKTQLQ